MTRDELLEKLKSIEWNDIEFKEATFAIPKNALETVSAFANTQGGHLVFGVREENGSCTILGVSDADRLQNDFLGLTRDPQKISVFPRVVETIHALPEGLVLCFFIPEAPRAEKPVYLDRNPRNAFIRRGGGDYRCTGDELMRFIRDAGNTPYDSEALQLNPETFYDPAALRRYRSQFDASKPGADGSLDDAAFLRNWGFLIEKDGQLRPTRAAVLVLGSAPYVRQELPRMVVDLHFYPHTAAEYSPDARWADRVTVEANLIEAWDAILAFYLKHSERPFSIDSATLRRHDDPPDYVSFREAAINLLIHQDFGDAGRVPTIRFFRDRTEFFNPGDAFASREQLLDPGDKDVRNPRIVAAFRRIGLSDQAGSGVGAIFQSWRRLGYLPPEIDNDKAEKTFRLRLLREKLVTEEQLLAQASLGVDLSENEAAAFAFLIREGEIDLTDIKALTGLSGADARKLAERLTVQVILRPAGGEPPRYALVDHLRARFLPQAEDKSSQNQLVDNRQQDGRATEQVTEQVARGATDQVVLRELSAAQWAVVEHAEAPRSMAELMAIAGYRQRPNFIALHLQPLLDGGIIRMTVPDKPRSSRQRYVLTEAGLKLKALRLQDAVQTVLKEHDA